MNRTLKIVGLSAIGTTLFWGGVLALVLFRLPGKTVEPACIFRAMEDNFSVAEIGRFQTQGMTVLVEDLGPSDTNFFAVGPPLIRRELKPGEGLRLGVRTRPAVR